MRTLWTPRWMLVHAAVVVMVVAFGFLAWWQLGRAADGNVLSFGYAIEWPAFAIFTIYVWVREMRRAVGKTPPAPPAEPVRGRPRVEAAYDDSDDDQLAAYNRYLAWLNANPNAPISEYRG